jgi:hypothetical protein
MVDASPFGDLSGTAALSAPPAMAPRTNWAAEAQKTSAGQAKDVSALADIARSGVQRAEADRASAAGPPPQMQAMPPPPTPTNTSPAQQWGSMAMLAAGLGGLLTRQHATAALNAAADAIKGFHQGDQDATNQAFQQWKVANDNTVKIMNYQMQAYRAAMEDASKSQEMDLRESDLESLPVRADIATKATAFGNKRLADAANNGDTRTMLQLLNAQNKAAAGLAKQGQILEKQYEVHQNIQALQSTPEYQSASTLDKLKMAIEVQKSVAPQFDTRGDGTKADTGAAGQVYKLEYTDPNGGLRPPGSLMPDGSKVPTADEFYENIWPTWGDKGPSKSSPASGAGGIVSPNWTGNEAQDRKTFDALPIGAKFELDGRVITKTANLAGAQ